MRIQALKLENSGSLFTSLVKLKTQIQALNIKEFTALHAVMLAV